MFGLDPAVVAALAGLAGGLVGSFVFERRRLRSFAGGTVDPPTPAETARMQSECEERRRESLADEVARLVFSRYFAGRVSVDDEEIARAAEFSARAGVAFSRRMIP
jgi:hypothetical protein